jgi:hypothetical protein
MQNSRTAQFVGQQGPVPHGILGIASEMQQSSWMVALEAVSSQRSALKEAIFCATWLTVEWLKARAILTWFG